MRDPIKKYKDKFTPQIANFKYQKSYFELKKCYNSAEWLQLREIVGITCKNLGLILCFKPL